MATDPTVANYGRARYGQLAPRQSSEQQYRSKMRNPFLNALQGGSAEQTQQQEQGLGMGVESPQQRALAAPPRTAQPRHSQPSQQNMLDSMRLVGSEGGLASGQLTPTQDNGPQPLQQDPTPPSATMSPPQGKLMGNHNEAWKQIRQMAQPQQQTQPHAPQVVNTPDRVQEPTPTPTPSVAPSVELTPSQQAYQEYLGEFEPNDPEQPMAFEQFDAIFGQLEPDVISQASAQIPARAGFNNINLDMVGQQQSPMGLLGFNNDRAFSGGDEKSMKDALARSFATNPVDLRGLSKEQVGQYLASPEFAAHMAQTGLIQGQHWDVMPGEYDRIMVNSVERGWEPVDIVGNAGSNDAIWTYQAAMDQQPNQALGGNPMQQALLGNNNPLAMYELGEGDPAYWEQILAQLYEEMNNRQSQGLWDPNAIPVEVM